MTKKKQIGYSMSVDYIVDMMSECDSSLPTLKALMEHFIQESHEKDCTYEITMVAELLWANLAIIQIFEKEIEDPVFVASDDKKEEIILMEGTLQTIQSLVFSKELATGELRRLSISTLVQ